MKKKKKRKASDGEVSSLQGLVRKYEKIAVERNRIEARLQASEARFRGLFEAARDGILILDGESGEIVEVNPSLVDMFGYSRGHYLGKKLWEAGIFTDAESAERVFEEARKMRYVRYEDALLRARGGRPVDAECTGSLYEVDRVRVVQFTVRDISERKTLAGLSARLAAIVESSNDAIIGMDLEGTILSWNEGAERIFGYSEKEALGRTISFLSPASLPDESSLFLESVRRGGKTEALEAIRIRKDGRQIYVSLSISPIKDAAGARIGVSTIARDITAKKIMEAELLTLSFRDELTNLYNRRGFLELAEQGLKIAKRNLMDVTLLYIDVDKMKWINDMIGHLEGDKALAGLASVLSRTCRESDVVARIGGDEFVVLAMGLGREKVGVFIERLRRAIAFYNSNRRGAHDLSVSIGTTTRGPADTSTIADMLAAADAAMYRDKETPDP